MDGWADRLPARLVSLDDASDRPVPHAVAEADLGRAFAAAVTESAALAVRVAYSVLRHQQDAEDVAQEAFVRAHLRFRQLRDREKFRAWLVRITWRLAIDRQRANRRRAAREGEHARQQPRQVGPDDGAARDRAAALWRAVDALPDRLRLVIVLANMEGHDINEVGRLLGVPAGTVKSRLFEARARLKEMLS
jgi:RNA polymerase sigma-70 factor (ECF subfamily)